MTTLTPHSILQGSPYQAYVYAYPHKTAYRPFNQPYQLQQLWQSEPRDNLFLYLHVPFCTMRCGFCNLFTAPRPSETVVTHFLDTLHRQAQAVRRALPDGRFARFAIGGGTPTYLTAQQLDQVFDLAENVMGAQLQLIPVGIETSPDTITKAHIDVLRSRGVDRVSIGVQSFVESEAANSGRPQSRIDVDTALSLLHAADFPILNIDLIYGLPNQTVTTWLSSLRQALQYQPEELYLYPLYVRPLTGLGRSRKAWDDIRMACYRAGRELLLAKGYQQISMRMFQRGPTQESASPAYCCQDDGMVGLGCGARSYTRQVHYSLDYAVEPRGVKAILNDYLMMTTSEFELATAGFVLDREEQRRRYLLQSLLQTNGLHCEQYAARFSGEPQHDFPELKDLAEQGLLGYDTNRWWPTALGLKWSDALGPYFFSPRVRALTAEYQPK